MVDSLLMYSTNTWLKYHIQEKYRGGIHYVWCSGTFNPGTLPSVDVQSELPPTSSPFDIYGDLYDAVDREDRHNAKIVSQKNTLGNLVRQWLEIGDITGEIAEDILYLIQNATFKRWRPLLYLIPMQQIEPGRIKRVPIKDRASWADEFIIEDLKSDEFEFIEPY